MPSDTTGKHPSVVEGAKGDKDSEGKKQPADMEPINPSDGPILLGTAPKSQAGVTPVIMASQAEQTHSVIMTTGSGPDQTKGESFYKEEPVDFLGIESMGDFQAFIESDEELREESDEEVFEAGEDMETDVQSEQPEQSHQSSPRQSEESGS